MLFHLLSKTRGGQSRLCSFYGEAANPSLPHVQRTHGNSDSRSGEECSTYPRPLHEMRLRLSVDYHSIVGDLMHPIPWHPRGDLNIQTLGRDGYEKPEFCSDSGLRVVCFGLRRRTTWW